ncbi:hypothetical protein WN943_029590 [Citrus x changshan-huyou]
MTALSDFDKEFAIDGNLINDQNVAKDAKVLDDAGFSSDDETIDIDPELLSDTSCSDYDLGTTKLKDYTKVHAYKRRPNDKHGLRLRDVFDDINHFRNALEKKKAHSWTNIPNQVKNELDDAYEVESKAVQKRDLLFINEEKVIEVDKVREEEDVVEEQQIKVKEVLFHINV